MIPLKVLPGDDGAPLGVLYPLGWTVSGPICTADTSDIITCSRIALQNSNISPESSQEERRLASIDISEHHTDKDHSKHDRLLMDRRFLTPVQDDTRHRKVKDRHQEMPLRDMKTRKKRQATRCHSWQKKRMLQDETWQQNYTDFREKVTLRGYDSKMPPAEISKLNEEQFNLPYHAMYHPT